MPEIQEIALIDNTINMITDKGLIEDARQDPSKFEALYDRYFTKIFGFVLNRVNNKTDSADITSQVFLMALLNIGKYEYKGLPFSAWLYRIAINECNAFFRASKKSGFVVLDDSFSEKLKEKISYNDEKQGDLQQLKAVLHTLDEREIQLLELRFYENKPFKEIGYILNISESHSKVRLYRLISKMRKKIKGIR